MTRGAGRPRIVVKLGGSLLGGARLERLIAAIIGRDDLEIAIVTGGGPFANAIRDIQARIEFSGPLAHRFALDAMDKLSDVLAEREPRLQPGCTTATMEAAWSAGRVPLWSTSEVRNGHAAITESWAVTSDSLAAWVAAEIGAALLVLVKSVDAGPATPELLAAQGVVDDAFPSFASRFGGTILVAGPADDDRFGQILQPSTQVDA
jgi:aspartokinase-like uncharacterized kinase